MKQKIFITERERKEILGKHSNFSNFLLENVTDYTVADIKKELNTNYGGTFTSSPYNDKFGPYTAGKIIEALDVVKTKGVQGTNVKPVETQVINLPGKDSVKTDVTTDNTTVTTNDNNPNQDASNVTGTNTNKDVVNTTDTNKSTDVKGAEDKADDSKKQE